MPKYSLAQIESESMEVYAEMQRQGLRVDTAYLDMVVVDAESALGILGRQLDEATGTINTRWTSTRDVARILALRGHDIPATPTGRDSVTKAYLVSLQGVEPLAEPLIKFRDLSHLKSQATGILEKVQDSKVYPQYRFDSQLGRVHSGVINPMNWGC